MLLAIELSQRTGESKEESQRWTRSGTGMAASPAASALWQAQCPKQSEGLGRPRVFGTCKFYTLDN